MDNNIQRQPSIIQRQPSGVSLLQKKPSGLDLQPKEVEAEIKPQPSPRDLKRSISSDMAQRELLKQKFIARNQRANSALQVLPPSQLVVTQKLVKGDGFFSKVINRGYGKLDVGVGNKQILIGGKLEQQSQSKQHELNQLINVEMVDSDFNLDPSQTLEVQRDTFIQTQRAALVEALLTTQHLEKRIERLEKEGDPNALEQAKTDLAVAQKEYRKLNTFLKKVDGLDSEVHRLRSQAENVAAIGQQIKGGRKELATKYVLIPLAKLAKAVQASLYFSLMIGAIKAGSTVIADGAAAIGLSELGLKAIGAVGAVITIVIESFKFFKTARKHNQGLSRIEMAEVLTASPQERGQKAIELWNRAADLKNNTGTRILAKLKPFSNQSDYQVLEAKALAIANLPGTVLPQQEDAFAVSGQKITTGLSKNPALVTPGELKLTAQQTSMIKQVKEYANIKHKRLSMLKNTVAIAGAVLTLVAVSIACPPAGLLIAAGVVGAVSMGFGMYLSAKSGKTIINRNEKILETGRNLDFAESKLKDWNQQIEEFKASKDMNLPESQMQLGYMKQELNARIADKEKWMVKNMAVSPQYAANEIAKGVAENDPVSLFMAQTVFGIKQADKLPESVVIDLITRGLQPNPDK